MLQRCRKSFFPPDWIVFTEILQLAISFLLEFEKFARGLILKVFFRFFIYFKGSSRNLAKNKSFLRF